jgi:hypothetical protein
MNGHFVEKRSRGSHSVLRSFCLRFLPLSCRHSADDQAVTATAVSEEFGITGHIRSITADHVAAFGLLAHERDPT